MVIGPPGGVGEGAQGPAADCRAQSRARDAALASDLAGYDLSLYLNI